MAGDLTGKESDSNFCRLIILLAWSISIPTIVPDSSKSMTTSFATSLESTLFFQISLCKENLFPDNNLISFFILLKISIRKSIMYRFAITKCCNAKIFFHFINITQKRIRLSCRISFLIGLLNISKIHFSFK